MVKLIVVLLVLLAAPTISGQTGSTDGVIRSRLITLPTLTHARSTTLTLFDDVTLNLVFTKTTPRSSGSAGVVWAGLVEGEPLSSAVLVMGEGVEYGQIVMPGRVYVLTEAGAGLHTVSEIDSGVQQTLQYQTPVTVHPSRTIVPRSDSGQFIDVMVVYTQNAKAIAGGTTASVRAAIESAVALTNDTFEWSAVNTRLRLVHMREVFYQEQPNIDFDADLNNLTGKTDGFMDEIHPLRDSYGADLVVLVAGTWFNTYCGTGWLPSALDEAYGFSITEARCLSGLSFAHQIGHNMGSGHDRANADEIPITPYAYGYQDPSTGGGDYADFVTIMALNTGGECPPILQSGVCPVIPRWSNPVLLYQGKPLGVPVDQPDAAYNALSLNEAAVAVANYRAAVPERELLNNGDFEINVDTDKIPDFWTPTNFSVRDGVTCNTLERIIAYSGMCAVRLFGGMDRFISQPISRKGLLMGDTLILTGYVKRKKVTSGGFMRVVVNYIDGSRGVLRLNVPAGSGGLTLLSGRLTLKGAPKNIKIELRYRGTSGNIIFDQIRLGTPVYR